MQDKIEKLQEKIDLANKIKEIEGFVEEFTDCNPVKWDVRKSLKHLQSTLGVIRELQNEIQNLLTENDVAGFINTNNLQKTIALTEENAVLKAQVDRVKDTNMLKDLISCNACANAVIDKRKTYINVIHTYFEQ